MADVFISHSSKDRAVAEQARERIERAGFRCWMAPRDIMPGQDYGEAIVDAIRASRIFLLVFSSASVDSAQVRRETERAANAGLAIIPFRIEDVQPSKSLEYFISSAHWLDAHEGAMEPHLDYLVEVVAKLLGSRLDVRSSEPEPSRPRSPATRAPRRIWPVAAGGAAIAAAVLIAFLMFRPDSAGRNCTSVPDTARTGFTLRASPARSDKPLRLRESPSGAGRQLAVIGSDEIFRIAPGQTGEWWAAQLCDGTTGFVSSRLVSLLDRPAQPPGDAK